MRLLGEGPPAPGIKVALQVLERGDARALVVAKLDRLSRLMLDFTAVMARAQKEGWALVALDCAVDRGASVRSSAAEPSVVADVSTKRVRLEDLAAGTRVRGVIPETTVSVVQVAWHGDTALTLTYRDDQGTVGEQILYRDDEARLEVEQETWPWSSDANGHLFRLASEALRIRLAYLFDPYLAVHTSNLEPLPHQIQAVYREMIDRQPLRFLLADDPGAGKTIMSGLLIKAPEPATRAAAPSPACTSATDASSPATSSRAAGT